MKTKSLTQACWLWAWLIMPGYNVACGEVVNELALIEAGDLFVTPKLFMDKQVWVSGGGVLCLDETHCVVENPLSPTLFMRLDTRLMKPEDKRRLAKECHQLLCSELLIGSLTRDGFQATRSYASQRLLPSQTQELPSFLIWDSSKPRVMGLRRNT